MISCDIYNWVLSVQTTSFLWHGCVLNRCPNQAMKSCPIQNIILFLVLHPWFSDRKYHGNIILLAMYFMISGIRSIGIPFRISHHQNLQCFTLIFPSNIRHWITGQKHEKIDGANFRRIALGPEEPSMRASSLELLGEFLTPKSPVLSGIRLHHRMVVSWDSGTPSYHPFQIGNFHEIDQLFLGTPIDGNYTIWLYSGIFHGITYDFSWDDLMNLMGYFHGIHPLVKVHMIMEHHHFSWVINELTRWPWLQVRKV